MVRTYFPPNKDHRASLPKDLKFESIGGEPIFHERCVGFPQSFQTKAG
jgi:hypothetical protein